jgi:hypothetical protein
MDRKMAEVRTWLWRSVRVQVNTSEGNKPANRVVTYAKMWRERGGREGATCLLRKSTPALCPRVVNAHASVSWIFSCEEQCYR